MTSETAKSEPQVHRVRSGGVIITVEEYGREHQDADTTSVVFLPALGVALSYYRPLLESWAERGRHVLGVEMRGGPQSPVANPRRQSFGYAQMINDDLATVFTLDAIATASKVVLVGHSLGGHLALLSAASGALQPAGVVTIGTGTASPASQTSRSGRLRRRVEVGFVRMTIGMLGYWPGHRVGFGGRQPKGLMADWAFEATHGRYRLAGDPTDYEAALAALGPPTLLIALEGDPMIPPPAVAYLASRLPAQVEHRMLTGEHARDHFLWARRSPGLMIDEVEGWLARMG